MKDHEFYQKYANLPVLERSTIIKIRDIGHLSLFDIYLEIKKIDDKIRNDIIRKEHMIRAFEEYFYEKNNI